MNLMRFLSWACSKNAHFLSTSQTQIQMFWFSEHVTLPRSLGTPRAEFCSWCFEADGGKKANLYSLWWQIFCLLRQLAFPLCLEKKKKPSQKIECSSKLPSFFAANKVLCLWEGNRAKDHTKYISCKTRHETRNRWLTALQWPKQHAEAKFLSQGAQLHTSAHFPRAALLKSLHWEARQPARHPCKQKYPNKVVWAPLLTTKRLLACREKAVCMSAEQCCTDKSLYYGGCFFLLWQGWKCSEHKHPACTTQPQLVW